MMLLAMMIVYVESRVLTESAPIDIVQVAPLEHPEHRPSASIQFSDHSVPIANRHRREAFYDPYDVYYYYPTPYNPRPVYFQSYINRRDTDDNRITDKGQKYKYTPLFQYKSTQTRRRKLFVPNLFG